MTTHFFANSRAKLWRANEQLNDLYSNIQAVFDSKEHCVTLDHEKHPYPRPEFGDLTPPPWVVVTFFFSDAPRIGKEHGLAVGEALHHFRGALDHLVWDLVRVAGKRNLSAGEKRNVSFPMASKRKNFIDDWNRKLPDVSIADYGAIFDRYQPYCRSSAGRAMRRLRNLSDADKHRLIVPTNVLPQQGNFTFEWDRDPISRKSHLEFGREVKPGTKFVTFVMPDSKAKVSVEGKVYSVPAFPPSLVPPTPGEGKAVPISSVLNEISLTCLQIMNEVEVHL